MKTLNNWGATAAEWQRFVDLGLTADLLPVVSNPKATISPNSRMKGIGKTPSRYNGRREVAGIADWTSRKTTEAEIQRWMAEPDYGICIQTREVRALDIDVDDPAKSAAIVQYIFDHIVGGALATRVRANSGKCLLAFKMPGEFAKRVLKVDGGIIEFLANGQQFIAAGTHTSGQRYQWNELTFIDIEPEHFESMWAELVDQFAIETPTIGVAARKRGQDLALTDEIIGHLDVLDYGKDGQAYITCPFEAEHTSDTGIAATAYFPKGSNGYEQGHFVCLHAHCQGREDTEFLDALGLRVMDFDVLPDEPVEPGETEVLPLPNFKRKKDGTIVADVNNIRKALERLDFCGVEIAFDEFRDEVVLKLKDQPQWRPFVDVDYIRLRMALEQHGFAPVSRELIRDTVLEASKTRSFDSGITWLESLKWDGKPRIERFCEVYLGTEDTPYTRAVGTYLWTALAGRVMEPGCKADMVPIFMGKQGSRKSTAVAAIAPSRDCFCEISFAETDDNLARKMRGQMVAEIGELRGLHTKELEGIKAFITKTHEQWIPKYQEFGTKFARRVVFIGTTNQEQFLADETGNRRWLPMKTGECKPDLIAEDRDQLWAEARETWGLVGVYFDSAQKLAEDEHAEFIMHDTWEDVIAEWLERDDLDGVKPGDKGYIRALDVLTGALGFNVGSIKKGDEMRVGKAFMAIGYCRALRRIDGKVQKVWVKTVTTCNHLSRSGGYRRTRQNT